MAVTLSVKSAIVDLTDADSAIATALNDSATYTNIYSVFTQQISNTKAKIIIIYD